MKQVAIVQSSYLPWKGYFDLIRAVDEFILYDDAQYTKRDWRNRNRIKTANGPVWLSIPVEVKGKYFQAIKDTRVADPSWNERHLNVIHANYVRAPFYRALQPLLEEWFLGSDSRSLSEVNARLISRICGFLEIATRLSCSMAFTLPEGRTERLLAMCRQAGATEYVSGPSARSYIDEDLFAEAGISLKYVDYSRYPEYPQLHGPFDHHVSIIDLLLNTGTDALSYMLRL